MRLIDADALHGKVKMETNPYGKPTIDYDSGVKVLEWIDKAPTVDAVPVVRCKDCVHSYADYSFDDLCGLCCTCGPYVDSVVQPDFYCADGKRKW